MMGRGANAMARRAWDLFRSEQGDAEERKQKALRALERLAALREGLPPVDAVEVIRSVREDPADRETR
jgi:hypothetical protein